MGRQMGPETVEAVGPLRVGAFERIVHGEQALELQPRGVARYGSVHGGGRSAQDPAHRPAGRHVSRRIVPAWDRLAGIAKESRLPIRSQ